VNQEFNPHSTVSWTLVKLAAGAVLVFLLLPLLVLLPMSFTSISLLVFPPPGYSLRWYEELLTNPVWRDGAWVTLKVGIASTLVATVLGTCFSIGAHKLDGRIAGAMAMLLMTPMIVPVIVTAVAMFFGYSQMGFSSTILGLIVGHAVLGLPFVVLCVSASLRRFDQRLFDAALSLGASPLRATFTVLLPLILPGIVTGVIFAFAASLDDVVVALFLGSPQDKTLPRVIFSGLRETISPSIASISVLLTLVSVGLLLIVERLRGRASKD
jgi:putative spermidine/putrescine transport system permease protein